jgi:hypothetical protein
MACSGHTSLDRAARQRIVKKKRTYNPRLVSQTLSYSVQEIAELFGLHKNAVLRWIKDGLSVNDQRKPYLVHGSALTSYLKGKQGSRKHKCKPDEFFCCKCRVPRKAWESQADIVVRNESKLSISALCVVCGTKIHRAGAVKKLAEYQKIFSIQTLEGQHIIDRMPAAVMCDSKEEMKA